MTGLHAFLFPAERRRLPGWRWWNIAARTIHIGTTGILLGGHVFGVAAERLLPLLWGTIASGAVLVFLEIFPSAHWLHRLCGVSVLLKMALLCVIPWAWNARVPILLLVVVLGSVGSHLPRKVRHWSVRYRRVFDD